MILHQNANVSKQILYKGNPLESLEMDADQAPNDKPQIFSGIKN